MKILDYIPDRYVFFRSLKSAESVTHDKENFEQDFLRHLNNWKEMKESFGFSPLDRERKMAYFSCIDIDAKTDDITDEMVWQKYQDIISELGTLNFVAEKSGSRGVHIWILYDEPIEYKKIIQFNSYLMEKHGEEVFPSERKTAFGIRLPGMYKDQKTFSTVYDQEKNIRLDTLEKIIGFFKDASNSKTLVEAFYQRVTSEIPEDKKVSTPDQNLKSVGMVTGMERDIYFHKIWEHYLGEEPKIGSCKCPFHDDNTNSASILRCKTTKKLIFNCFADRCIGNNKDSFDVLHMFEHGNLKKSQKSIRKTYQTMQTILAKEVCNFLKPTKSGVELSSQTVADFILDTFDDPDTPALKRDDQYILHDYKADKKVWKTRLIAFQEDEIIKDFVRSFLEKNFSEAGFLYMENDIPNIFSKLKTLIAQPRYEFRSNIEDKRVIPFSNGILDLDTNKFRKIQKTDYITCVLDTEYNPVAENKEFEECLFRVLPKEIDRENFLLYLGSALAPSVKTHEVLMCPGPGGNGKSTITNIINAVFGEELVSHLRISDLNDKFKPQVLVNKWLNIDADANTTRMSGDIISILKQITGGDAISFERKYAQPFSKKAICNFMVFCNQVPYLGEVDRALQRRLVFVPFEVKFKSGNENHWQTIVDTPEKKSGIINYILPYTRKYLYEGKRFEASDEAKALMQNYYHNSDPLLGYIKSLISEDYNDASKFPLDRDKKRLLDPQLEAGVTSSALFADFELFCRQTNRLESFRKIGYTNTNFPVKLSLAITENFSEEVEIKKIRNKNHFKFKLDK